MENEQNYVALPVADGSEMAAYTALPENTLGKLPAIMVLQEAYGVNHHIRSVTERFAKEGYIAISPELFHRTASKGFEGDYNDFSTVTPHTKALTIEGFGADLKATYKWLIEQGNVDQNRIYSVGYCMGGRVSFLANALLPLKAAVSYYGGALDTVADSAPQLHGKHLFFWGGLDKHIKSENIHTVIRAVEAAGKDFINVKISYADHGFNCDARSSYNEAASKEAWALTLAFLKD
ncbi:MAG: Carboxymethylenebutenolidase [Mucilaginibacter sp.]|nr:Carboxymethylenebutenolidase [Mucilaginibacter sp.]